MRPAIVFCLTLVSIPATGSALADGTPVTLVWAHKKGQMTRYTATTTMKAAGGEGVQTSKHHVEVTEIRPNGEVVLVTHLDGGHIKSPLGEQDFPGGNNITETRDRQGRLVKWSWDVTGDTFLAEEVRQLLTALNDVILPEKPVSAGDSWKTDADDPAAKGKKIAYTTTFVGIESLEAGPKLWKLKQTATAEVQAASSTVTSDLTEWIDPTSGTVVRADNTITGVPTQFGALSFISKLSAVKDEPATKKEK